MRDDDDIQLQSYQDDLDIDNNKTDPIMQELGDDPTKTFGIPADKFRDELTKEDIDLDDDEGDRDNLGT